MFISKGKQNYMFRPIAARSTPATYKSIHAIDIPPNLA